MATYSPLIAAVLLQQRNTGASLKARPDPSQQAGLLARICSVFPSSRGGTFQLPLPLSPWARNRAQDGLTHQSMALTDHSGAIRLVPHQRWAP